MQLRMWMYDLAREQCPTMDHLYQIAGLTLDAGFDSLGLYLEHRYAYPSTPWSHGRGILTPEMVDRLQSEFPSLRIIPFINLLGHFEGMLYTEPGKKYHEDLFTGMQACPSKDEFLGLCERIIDDTVRTFRSDIIHIGGDETWQLGSCPICKDKVESVPEGQDGKAKLYGEHFGPLAELVQKKGRRPAVWGDMYLQHPDALNAMPKETLIFDWQYFNGLKESAPTFTQAGFDVVGCPAIQTYNATWMHMEASEKNVLEVLRDVRDMDLYGVCVTTWECGLFGSYDTLYPAIEACGAYSQPNSDLAPGLFQQKYDEAGNGKWANQMSAALAECGGTFKPGRIRSSLKVRLLLNSNPFLAWLHHGEELAGEVGFDALAVFEKAMALGPGDAEKGITLFGRSAVEFVRIVEEAKILYAQGRAEAAITKLALTRRLFDDLAKVAERTTARCGGSLADAERCRIAKEHVERVIQRIRQYGDGSLGYLPAFEVITHPKFVPHDQACWWLINRWANQ
ncbi:MAG: family 20 glycosylhydrolase [Armatimonadetes bacterium]|nr:family 20 glycosylhydrolase [Armatimonadota bacterium]